MRFALIGLGSGGRALAQALRETGQELVAVADASPARAEAAARELGVPSFEASPEHGAERCGCDAVAVALPLAERFAAIRTALRAGCHVLVDGLPAAAPEQVLELEALASHAGRVLVTGPRSLHSASARRLRELARDSDAGPALGMRAWRARQRAARRVRDLLEVVALPDLVLFALIAGSEPSGVSARAERSALTGQIDSLSLSLWYPNGWPARLEIGGSESDARGVAVLCEQRRMLLDDEQPGKRVLWIEDQQWAPAAASPRGAGARREVSFSDSTLALCRSFASIAAGGRRPETPCLASALRVIRAAERQIEAQAEATSAAA